METKDESVIYWTQLKQGQWNMYVAATTAGLCYIGSPNAPFEEFAVWAKKRLPFHILIEDAKELQAYIKEIIAYLEGRSNKYTLAMDLHGTPFQQAVWQVLQELEYGQVVTYTDIAQKIGKPQSVRAVGSAIGANPVLLFVPCHRVIAKSGKLGGFRAGLEMKEQLLKLEQSLV